MLVRCQPWRGQRHRCKRDDHARAQAQTQGFCKGIVQVLPTSTSTAITNSTIRALPRAKTRSRANRTRRAAPRNTCRHSSPDMAKACPPPRLHTLPPVARDLTASWTQLLLQQTTPRVIPVNHRALEALPSSFVLKLVFADHFACRGTYKTPVALPEETFQVLKSVTPLRARRRTDVPTRDVVAT
ncbi:hypothetical protein NX059_012431 [Plenodomus lindquistii]|nr:hypothetical protein NX059_012431 [Plenodomus lindquistii]